MPRARAEPGPFLTAARVGDVQIHAAVFVKISHGNGTGEGEKFQVGFRCVINELFAFDIAKNLNFVVEIRNNEVVPAVVINIHEGRGKDKIEKTTIVNCGAAASGYYAVIELKETISIRSERFISQKT